MNESLYVDGGVIGRNPSLLGGTWAWCLVRDDKILTKDSGRISPEEMGLKKISNNVSELIAALYALEELPLKWDGVVYTDSLITLRRITNGKKFNGIPSPIVQRTLEVRRSRKWKTVLLAGHPTKAELESGVARRNGHPVSKWNVFCDEECKRLAKEFIATQTPKGEECSSS